MMKRIWTVETAKQYVLQAEKGKVEKGLTYLSAIDYVKNHASLANMMPHSIISF